MSGSAPAVTVTVRSASQSSGVNTSAAPAAPRSALSGPVTVRSLPDPHATATSTSPAGRAVSRTVKVASPPSSTSSAVAESPIPAASSSVTVTSTSDASSAAYSAAPAAVSVSVTTLSSASASSSAVTVTVCPSAQLSEWKVSGVPAIVRPLSAGLATVTVTGAVGALSSATVKLPPGPCSVTPSAVSESTSAAVSSSSTVTASVAGRDT